MGPDIESAAISLSIGEVAARAGVRPSAIRYYESIGLLPDPERVSGRRRYGPEIVPTLAVIETAQRAALSLREIGELLAASTDGKPVGDRLRGLAESKLPEVQRLIEQAQAVERWLEAARACQCPTFEDCPLF